MKNISNAYLVLSVAEIRAMLHAGELEKKVRGEDRESITIVLNNLVVVEDDYGDAQIDTCSLMRAVDWCVAASNEYLDNRANCV